MNIESTITIWLEAWRDHRDSQALSNLVHWQRNRAYNLARAIVGNSTDAEDVVQQACIKLLSRRVGFDDREAFVRTLNRAVIQCGRDLCRSRQSRQEHTKRFAQRAPEPATPSDHLVRKDTTDAVRTALDLLEEDERLAVVLCYQEGCTVSEAARSLDVPRETLRYRLSQGTNKLRDRLAKTGVAVGSAALFALLPQTGYAAPAALINRIGSVLGPSVQSLAISSGSVTSAGFSAATLPTATATATASAGSWSAMTILPGAAALIAVATGTILWSAPIVHATNASPLTQAPEPITPVVTATLSNQTTSSDPEPAGTRTHSGRDSDHHRHRRDNDHDHDDDEVEIELAIHEIPPEVLAAALKAVPGMVIEEGELRADNKSLIFDIEGHDPNGQAVEVEIEVRNDGSVENVEVEFDDHDDRDHHKGERHRRDSDLEINNQASG